MVVDSLQYSTIENSALRNTEAILGMVHGNIVFQQVFLRNSKETQHKLFLFVGILQAHTGKDDPEKALPVCKVRTRSHRPIPRTTPANAWHGVTIIVKIEHT